jgi:hypothetical protein
MSSITRAIVIAAQLALFSTAAHAQVISTWDGGTLWDDPENWNHSVPQAEGNWPKNGNGGFNYSVVINTPANALLASFEPVELNSLTLSGVGRFISGGSDLIILGSSTFEGIAGFNGGGGHFYPLAGVTVSSGEFHLREWDMDTDFITLGANGTLGRMLLFDGAKVNLDGTLALNFDSTISGEPDTKITVDGGTIVRSDGVPNGVASLNVPLDIQSGTIHSTVGELRFGPVFGFSPDQPLITLNNVTIKTEGLVGEDLSSLVRFDNVKLAVTGTLTAETPILSSDSPGIHFKDAVVQFTGSMTGDGKVTFSGSSGVLDGGTLNFQTSADRGFFHDGGTVMNLTNLGVYTWRAGTMTGTVTNLADTSPAFNLPNHTGPRLISNGMFINQGEVSQEAGTVTFLAGSILNAGRWTIRGGTLVASGAPDAGLEFENTGEFLKAFVSDPVVIDADFNNAGLVRCTQGTLTFREGRVKNYDEKTEQLAGGTWRATVHGRIIFEGGIFGNFTVSSSTTVNVDGPDASFDPLNKLSTNNGAVDVSGGKQQIITPSDGSVDNGPKGLFQLGDAVLATEGEVLPTRVTLPHLDNSGDVLVFGGAILNAIVGIDLHGGRLGGDNGNIVTPIINNIAGTVSPGMLPDEDTPGADTTGVFHIEGTYIQHPAGTLLIELGGVNFSQFDTLAITSSTVAGTTGAADAALDGSLQVKLVNGFVPQVGDSFTILTAGSIDGAFASLDLPILGAGQLDVKYEGAAVVIDVISGAGSLADFVSSETFQPPPDGVVDGADLAFLLGQWGRVSGGGSPADIVSSATFQPPGDGQVDGADLAFLLGEWTG